VEIHFLYRFRRKSYLRETVLLLSIREKINTAQSGPSKKSPSLVLVCHVCGHGYDYTADDIHLGPNDTPDPHLVSGPDHPVVLSAQIECAEQSCKSPIEAQMPMAIVIQSSRQGYEAVVSRWTLHDVKCPNGHAPKLPLALKWESR
jgi:hypothetical protein